MERYCYALSTTSSTPKVIVEAPQEHLSIPGSHWAEGHLVWLLISQHLQLTYINRSTKSSIFEDMYLPHVVTEKFSWYQTLIRKLNAHSLLSWMFLLHVVTHLKDEPLWVLPDISVVQGNGKGLDNCESTKHTSILYLLMCESHLLWLYAASISNDTSATGVFIF